MVLYKSTSTIYLCGYSCRFEELFTCLDASKTALGINNWGASVTTMEEVFLK